MKSLNWIQLILGVWVLISPWVLGFAELTPALWSNVVAGAVVAIVALWALFGGESSSS